MSSSVEKLNNEDYINLPKVFFGIISFIKGSISKILKILLVVNILCLGYYFFLYPNKYKSNMVAFSQFYHIEDLSVLIRNLNNLIESESYSEISKIFSISINEAKSIKKFSVTLVEFDKTLKEKSTIKEEEKYDIQVVVSNNLLLNKLNTGFKSYLMNNDFLENQSSSKRIFLEKLRDKISKELLSLDSLKNINSTGYNFKNDKASLLLYSPGDIYETIVKLYEQQIDVELKLNLGSDLRVIQGFTNEVPSTKMLLHKYILIVNIVAFIFICICLGLVDLSKKYSD